MNVTLDINAYIALDYLSEHERRRVQSAIERLRADTELSSPNLKKLDQASDELYDVYVYRVDPSYHMFFRRRHEAPADLEVTDIVRTELLKAFASKQVAH